ncbi:MAG: serine/threonine-protein kinase [Planctomycetota bacterium]
MGDRDRVEQWLPLRRLEDSWRTGQPADVNVLLSEFPGHEPALFGELVVLNFDLWWSTFTDPDFDVDEPPPVDVYLRGYPELKGDNGVLFELLFLEIINWHTLNEESYLRDYPQLENELKSLFELIRQFPGDGFSSWAKGVTTSVRMKRSGTFDGEPIPEEENAETSEPLLDGKQIEFRDVCEIEGELIGKGAFKRVYRGRQTSTGRIVAVKQLIKLSQSGVKSFLSEGRAQAAIDHQNIPPIVMLGGEDGETSLLLEKLIEAPDWSETIREKSLQARNLEILLTVSRAAEYAHRKSRLVHRDIKPQNILVGDFNEIYLADWGLAVRFDDSDVGHDEAVRKLSNEPEGYIIGPSGYMAPEMALGQNRQSRPQTDVFMLGALLYEILTGRPPYDAYPRTACLKAATYRYPEIPVNVPSELRAIAAKAMARDQEDRFNDAGEFADAIERYLSHQDAENQLSRAYSELEEIRRQSRSPERLTALIGVADQFRQSRELWETSASKTDAMGVEFASSGVERALEGEHAARELLVTSAVADGDLGLASAQVQRLAATGATETSESLDRMVRGAKTRRYVRNLLMFGSLVAAIALSLWVFASQARNAELRAENADERARSAELDAEIADQRARNAELSGQIADEKLLALESIRDAELRLNARSTAVLNFDQASSIYESAISDINADDLTDVLIHSIYPTSQIELDSAPDEYVLGRPLLPVYAANAGSRIVSFAGNEGVSFGARDFTAESTCSPAGDNRVIQGLALSPDGEWIAISDLQGTIELWEAGADECAVSVEAHKPKKDPSFPFPASIVPLAWRPDGELVASLSNDGVCKLWSVPEMELQSEFPVADEQFVTPPPEELMNRMFPDNPDALNEAIRFMQIGLDPKPDTELAWLDDQHLAIAGRDNVVRIWDSATGESASRWPLAARVSAMSVSRETGLIAVGTERGEIRVVSVPEDKATIPETVLARSLNTILDVASFGLPLQIEEDRRTTAERFQRQWVRAVHSLSISPNGFRLAVTLGDGSLSLVSIKNGSVLARGAGHRSPTGFLQSVRTFFASSGDLFTVGDEGNVKKWAINGISSLVDQMPDTARFDGAWDVAARQNADGWHVAGTYSFASLTDDSGSDPWTPMLGEKTDPAVSIARVPSSENVVVGTLKGQTFLYDPDSGAVVREFARAEQNESGGWINSKVAVSPDGQLVASSWTNGVIDVWNLEDGTNRLQLDVGAGRMLSSVQFSPDGNHIATAESGGRCALWKIEGLKVNLVFDVNGPFDSSLSFSPDGNWLVQCGSEFSSQTVIAWDVASGEKIQSLREHQSTATSNGQAVAYDGAFSPDGKLFATCGTDATVRIFRVNDSSDEPFEPYAVVSTLSIKALAEMPENKSNNQGDLRTWLASLAFSTDSRQIAAVGFSGPVHIIDLGRIEEDLALSPSQRRSRIEQTLGMKLEADRPVVID